MEIIEACEAAAFACGLNGVSYLPNHLLSEIPGGMGTLPASQDMLDAIRSNGPIESVVEVEVDAVADLLDRHPDARAVAVEVVERLMGYWRVATAANAAANEAWYAATNGANDPDSILRPLRLAVEIASAIGEADIFNASIRAMNHEYAGRGMYSQAPYAVNPAPVNDEQVLGVTGLKG